MATITDLHPRTTPGIKTRRALHGSSTRGHNSTENANSGPRVSSTSWRAVTRTAGASTCAPPAGRSDPAPLPYRGDEPMQMLVIALAIAIVCGVMLWWALTR